MTRAYFIDAVVETPFCLSSDPAMGNEVETLGYIPGSALRGMLADVYFRSGGTADADFREVFCSGKVRFAPLLPAGLLPMPLSAFTCKTAPGFWAEHDDTGLKAHGVWDLHFEDLAGLPAAIASRRCECGSPLNRLAERWYERSATGTARSSGAKVRTAARTSVRFETGQVLSGSLHTQVEIGRGSRFQGSITAEEPVGRTGYEGALARLFGRDDTIRLTGFTGRRRAGKVTLDVYAGSSPSAKPLFLDGLQSVPDGRAYFAMVLASDAIVVDSCLRPVVSLGRDAVVLERDLGFPTGCDVRIVNAFTAKRRVAGWDQAARIFKPDDHAIIMGSSFLLNVSDDTAIRKSVESWMRKVIERGIGLRRSEGFGQVRFDDPLHLQAAASHGGVI